MAVEPGGIFAEQIEIFAPVDIRQAIALAAGPGQRKRGEKEHRAGIAAGHMLRGVGLAGRALGMRGAILCLRLGERIGEIGVGSDGEFHGSTFL